MLSFFTTQCLLSSLVAISVNLQTAGDAGCAPREWQRLLHLSIIALLIVTLFSCPSEAGYRRLRVSPSVNAPRIRAHARAYSLGVAAKDERNRFSFGEFESRDPPEQPVFSTPCMRNEPYVIGRSYAA